MKNLVLTGFMGTGKTAVGRELSRMLDMKIVNIDTEIELSRKMTINEIFKNYGEEYFRNIETGLIKKFSEMENIIISTGGGAVLREENMELLRRNGVIFCLNASPATIFERTGRSGDRPLLKVDDPMAKIKELLDFRRPYYEKAGITIETDDRTPLQIAEEIRELFRCGR
ncbi:MAG: shikimate kinase [Nitrospirota bacterium]|nr:shikimate kinase [Nitrospirota bacterium]